MTSPEGGDVLSGISEGAKPELVDLAQVIIERVINKSNQSKMITFQGVYKGDPIVIRLEKTMFAELATRQSLTNRGTQVHRQFVNDIYSNYTITPAAGPAEVSQIQATIIWPANETVLAKYTHDDAIFFSETQEDFQRLVGPYIDKILTEDKNYNNWVYNILEGRSEAERVIYNNADPHEGFMVIPDLKWSGSLEDCYMLAICHRHDIKCLRDLNSSHLPLLRNILSEGTKAIESKFSENCKGKQLRSYVHYHPSFYHFHVHFKMVDPSSYESNDRDNLLSTIINNISLCADYYARSTLTYPLSQSNALYKELKKAGRLL